MKSARYLDQLAEHKHLKSDADIARFLGRTKGAISNYRHGTRVMENELCLRIALELGLDNPLPIIMAADADRAERIGQKSLWEVFSPKMAGISAAVIFAVVTNFVTPSPAQAAPAQDAGSMRFILCQILYRSSADRYATTTLLPRIAPGVRGPRVDLVETTPASKNNIQLVLHAHRLTPATPVTSETREELPPIYSIMQTISRTRTVNGRFYESRTQPSPCCG
jgi:transcriptional regulator with XRE-family HTH domain